jgi:PadR family transcriptional regulator PadR
MGKDRMDLLRGTLDMLILKTVSLEPLHGLGISRRIGQITRGAFQVPAGSLFPALHRMEQEGWIVGAWGESENNRSAKSYQLSPAGHTRLNQEQQNWERVGSVAASVLEAI